MGCLFLTGPNFNLLGLSGASIAVSPAADANFPATALYDRAPGTIFRFGALSASPTITLDLTDGMGGYGGLNAWTGGTPDGFTEFASGAGTVTQDNVNKQEGASSALFTPAAGGTCSLQRDVTVRTGWTYKLSAYGMNNSTGTLGITVFIQNLTTGRYYVNPGWSDSQLQCMVVGQELSWTQTSVTVPVEGYEDCRAETVTLRITFQAINSIETCNLDLIEWYPGVDFVSIHGHNIDPVIAVTLRSSTDNFTVSDTVEATLTTRVGAFYGVLGSKVYRRYWRLRFGGTNTSTSGAIYVGEGVLSQSFTLARGPDYPIRLRYRTPQVRVPNPYGAGGAYGMARLPTIGVGLDFRQDESSAREFFHEVFLRSIAGTPLVVVPDTNDSAITYGRIPDAYELQRVLTTWRQLGAIDIEPMPMPMIVG
jgi:hypothetical protein